MNLLVRGQERAIMVSNLGAGQGPGPWQLVVSAPERAWGITLGVVKLGKGRIYTALYNRCKYCF